MNESQKTLLHRALTGQSPQHRGNQPLTAKATTRDLDPRRGSAAILQKAASATGSKSVASLNVQRADGSAGKAFCWGVTGFGWGQGEWE